MARRGVSHGGARGHEVSSHAVVQVLALAKGRVWTGRQAHERGLVDHLGGLATAIDISRYLRVSVCPCVIFFPGVRRLLSPGTKGIEAHTLQACGISDQVGRQVVQGPD